MVFGRTFDPLALNALTHSSDLKNSSVLRSHRTQITIASSPTLNACIGICAPAPPPPAPPPALGIFIKTIQHTT